MRYKCPKCGKALSKVEDGWAWCMNHKIPRGYFMMYPYGPIGKYGGRKHFFDLIINDSMRLCGFMAITMFLFLAAEENNMCKHKWIKTKFKINLTGDKPMWVFRICEKCGTGSFVRDKKENYV